MVTQAPQYAIIGNGRMAQHMAYYLTQLSLTPLRWSRSDNSIVELSAVLTAATHLLVLIPDDAINLFIARHIDTHTPDLICVHFSGNLVSAHAYSAHPLQTFTETLFDLADYKNIPFVIEEEGPSFATLLPGLSNPHYKIKSEDKPYYHALCVMANNFSTLLWQKFFSEMQQRFRIPPHEGQPYLHQTFVNLKNDYQKALTGPINRQDKNTLLSDLTALEGDPFYSIFKTFIDTFTKGNTQ